MKSQNRLSRLISRRAQPFLIIGLLAIAGLIAFAVSHAATPFLNAEPENGTVTAPATKVADSAASGGSAIQFATSATPTPDPNPSPDPIGQASGQWALKFRDEFDGSSVTVKDAAKGLVSFSSGPTWKAWYPNDLVGDGNAHTNNPGTEIEYYDTSGLSVGDGLLTLTATHDNKHSGFAYTSGMIQSNQSFNPTYGYAEARIKVPGNGGSWPAFWMIPASYTWPPEIDIFENFGVPSQYEVSDFDADHTVFATPVTTDVTQWHVYGLKWSSNTLTWYLDGRQVANERTTYSIPKEPMYLVYNLAVTNSSGAQQTYATQADYIRFWQ